ncbi:MAG: glycine zipper 2TM domain-containing protein [Bdellovibrionales bacterium]
MKKIILFVLTISPFALPASAVAGDSSFWGTAMGATLGGYLGSTIGKGAGNLAATGAGVFIGGALGNSIGHSLDRANRPYSVASPRYYSYGAYTPGFDEYRPTYVAPYAPPPRTIYVEEAPQIIEYHYAPRVVHTTGSFVGPPSGARPPKFKHKNRNGQYCREFTQTIMIDGDLQESYGTACLRPDGSWQIVQ